MLTKVCFNDRYSVITQTYLFYYIVKSACFNYREFDLEDSIASSPNTYRASSITEKRNVSEIDTTNTPPTFRKT